MESIGLFPLIPMPTEWNVGTVRYCTPTCARDGRLELQDPDTGAILLDRQGMRLAFELSQATLRDRDERIRQLEEQLWLSEK